MNRTRTALVGAFVLIGVLLHRTRPTDRIVVGVDSENELDAAAAALSVSGSDASRFMETLNAAPPRFDASVLDPRTWSPGHTNTVTA